MCRGSLVPHLMSVDGHVKGFTAFHNVNCPQVSASLLMNRLTIRKPASGLGSLFTF